jgi:hypothetical protein
MKVTSLNSHPLSCGHVKKKKKKKKKKGGMLPRRQLKKWINVKLIPMVGLNYKLILVILK